MKDEDKLRQINTESDMMALYKKLWATEDWAEFFAYAYDKWFSQDWTTEKTRGVIVEFSAWLFCLSGEGYEERCQMVAEFLEAADEEGGKG